MQTVAVAEVLAAEGLAPPVKYGDSGIMTFIINRDGVV